MIPYYFGTPHIGADSFWLYTYAFQRERQILQKAWLSWIIIWMGQTAMPGCLRFAEVDQLWTAPAAKAYFGGESMLVSVKQPFTPLTFYCLHWLICFLPRVLECGRVWGTSNTKWLEEKPKSYIVPSSSLQGSLQGRVCTFPRESQHAWLLCVCLEYVLESAVEKVGFVSPHVGSWLVSHLRLRRPSRKSWSVL